MADTLAGVEDLRTFLGRPATFDPSTADLYLRLASNEVRAACGRTFDEVTDDVLLVDGTGTGTLLLPEPPITAVAEIVEAPGTDYEAVLSATTAFEWSATGVLRRLDGRTFVRRFRWYRVTYSHGFADVPDEVAGVVLRVAARSMTNPRGLKQEAIGRYSFTVAGESAGVGLLPADLVALGDLVLPGRRGRLQ